MKSRLLIAIALLSGGCYSDVALDATPQIVVDPRILGDWTCSPPDDAKQTAHLRVRAADKYRYAFSWQEPHHKRESYVAWASDVAGVTLFNVQALPHEDSGWPHPWAFVEAHLSSGVLQIQLLAQGVTSGRERSPQELREAFARALSRSDLLNKEEITLCRKRR